MKQLKLLFGNFEILVDAPNGIKKMREAILQFAVQGKLTEQWRKENPNVEPASELLKKIKAEKEKLIKEGKIKKGKPLPPITEEEVPFEIPESWKITRINEVAYLKSGMTIPINYEKGSGDILYLKVGDMNLLGNEKYITTSSRYVDDKDRFKNNIIHGNSIIFPKRGGAIATNKKRIVTEDILVDSNTMSMFCNFNMSLDYLFFWFLTIDLWELNSGTSVPQINNKDIEPLLMALPPFAEQQEIVRKVDQLMALCDELEKQKGERDKKRITLNTASLSALPKSQNHQEFNKNWQHITDNFNTLYSTPENIKKLKETILQLAVQGKLTESWRNQNPNVEPASEPLKKIKAEKEKLIKEGKIKKGKPLPPITEEEIPFEIPEKWDWHRLDSLSEYIQRGKGPKYIDKSDIPVISQKCIQWSGFDITVARFIDPNSLSKYTEERFLRTGDLLWNSTGTGTIGRINLYSHDSSKYEKVVVDSHVTIVRPMKINCKYLCLFLSSPIIQYGFEDRASGTTNQIELNTSTVKDQLAPLPPLQEQQEIVRKVELLMALCDELETTLTKSQDHSEKLINSILNQAVNT